MQKPLIAAIALALGAALGGARVPGGVVVSGELGRKIDEFMSRLEAWGFSGAVIVAKDGQVAISKGYGLANRELKIPFTPETVSSIGSITKQFTAAAILKLEMQGKLKVTDPVSKYLPDVPPDKAEITIHHLLTHTAGFRANFGGRDADPIARDDLVKLVLTTPLRFKPGERYEYSNEGYSLAGAIVERVSGVTYETFLSQNLFKPAGMMSTGYVLPKWPAGRLARGYIEGVDWGSITEKGWLADGPGWYLKANGGIHSTILDMYRWHLALEGEAILSNEAKTKFFTPYVKEGPNADSHYAYGWAVFTTPRDTTLIAHNGGNGVFFADFRRYVDENVVIYAHSNAEMSAIDVTNVVPAIVFGGEYVMPPAVVPLDPATLSKFAGTYTLPNGETLTITEVGGRLTATPNGDTIFALLSGLTPPGGERFAEVERQTRSVLEASAKRDYAILQKALGNVPLERLTFTENRLWDQRRGRFGELKSVELVGSGRRGPDVVVIAKLVLERGSVLVRFMWDPPLLVGRQIVDAPSPPDLRPVSPAEFATFTIGQPLSLKLHFDVDAAGAVGGATISLGATEVVAKKTG
jgi:CubicO group peptidase (beta-lactamase class C family)